MAAPSVYPGAYDDLITSHQGVDPKAGHANVHNLVGAAIEAMQAEMGINPSGGFNSIRAKLDFLWDETDTPVGADVLAYDSGAGKIVALKLTDASISSAAALGIAKLAGYPSDSSKFLRGDGIWASAVTPETSMPTGTILMFAGVTPPAGYLLCDGTQQLRSSYPALDGVIGTIYGGYTNGIGQPGVTHLLLPDFRGRVAVGRSPSGNALVDNLGDNDGRPSNTRSISHRHYITNSGGGSSSILGFAAANLDGFAFWTSGDANNPDHPAYLVINYIIKT